ncbi:hypothetical protein [Isoptericola rhizosphaerae]|uniref:hypothetical protein n=1 Tax=Isoptericola rhizosphaerae TaxID=3377837 RepID=UPI00383B0C4F
MAIRITFTGEDGTKKLDDKDQRCFRYAIAPNGALYILTGPEGLVTANDLRVSSVYGPTAWWRVDGDSVSSSLLDTVIG